MKIIQPRRALGSAVLLIVLLANSAAALKVVFASTPQPGAAYYPASPQAALALPAWEQANSNGFGDSLASEVTALESYGGYLYAGTHSDANDALIYRSPDGLTWSTVIDPGFGISHDIAPRAILDFAIFNNQLYTSTGRGGNPGQIYRTLDGVNWSAVVIYGFSDQDNVDITSLAEYNAKIYAGVTNVTTGAQIWSSFNGDSNSWTQSVTPGLAESRITAFAEFDGAFYAAVESAGPAQIWESLGAEWTAIVSDGFGESNTTSLSGLAVFGGYLYAGAGNNVEGAQLWRTQNALDWSKVVMPAFSDPNNKQVEMVLVFQDQLYISLQNSVTGVELWRTADGVNWEQVNPDGFGDSHNTSVFMNNANAEFKCQLYLGTLNSLDGGELWRMQPAYAATLSADQAKTGSVGQNVIYNMTITNTGGLSDGFDLSSTGQSWTTTITPAMVNLAPSGMANFTVTVSIPPGATNQQTDTATIVARSQGGNCDSDDAKLSTTASLTPVYGVTLSPDEARSGSAGAQVIYNLTVTNTGNVQETFNLQTSGNTWLTSLSVPTITLVAGASDQVTVTVTIPPTAAASDSDQVTITAISQHDNTKTDNALLTTTSTGAPKEIFLPYIQKQ